VVASASKRPLRLVKPRECEPQAATERTRRRSYATAVVKLAAAQGWSLMPWQRRVLGVALEYEANGVPAYRTVVVTVPRQNGKTTLLWSLMLWWALSRAHNVIIATAQTGIEAMDKWREYVNVVEHGPHAQRIVAVRYSNGSEVLEWDTGTSHRVRAPSPRAGHGVTLDLGVIDEAWALRDEAVIQSMRPAMATRPHAQLWIVSTAGTHESVLLRRHVELGRRAVADGKRDGLAYFEWAAPAEADPDDPETWRQAMPAMGYTITPEVVKLDRESMTPGEFDRAYLNRWTDTAESAVPAMAWHGVQYEDASPQGSVWLGVDMTPERDAAAIVAGGWWGERVAVEVIDHRPGTDWLVPRVNEVIARHQVAGVVIDSTGPAAAIAADLREPPVMFTYRNMQHASAQLYDAIVYGALAVRPHAGLNASIRGAVKLGQGDLWRWGRRRSAADVSPLCAATLAHCQARANRGADLRIF
jgi:phage terminase large subunit-like protein